MTLYYIVGLIVVGFIILMIFVNRSTAKLNKDLDNIDLKGCDCIIISRNGPVSELEYGYLVSVSTVYGNKHINILSRSSNFQIGSKHTIKVNAQGIYYI